MYNSLLPMYHCGVSGIRNMHIKNGTGIHAPRMASCFQLRYFPAKKHIKIPLLPKVVGKRPNVPLTWGCTVSPKYTGRPSEATPTQNPAMARPAIIICTLTAMAIRIKAVNNTNNVNNIKCVNFQLLLYTCINIVLVDNSNNKIEENNIRFNKYLDYNIVTHGFQKVG